MQSCLKPVLNSKGETSKSYRTILQRSVKTFLLIFVELGRKKTVNNTFILSPPEKY